MKYTIKHGLIAAIQYIHTGDGREPCVAVYMGPERLDPQDKQVHKVEYDRAMPIEVQAVVNRNFGVMFSVPVGRRENLIRTIQPTEVEA